MEQQSVNLSLSFTVRLILMSRSSPFPFSAHIATVGKAMSSSEEVAYPILRKHDVEYVLVIFGGLIGYSGDDINKFLWMVRIAQGVWPEEIQEPNYFTPKGEYRVDDAAPATMKNSLMYKMSYYRCVGPTLACFPACGARCVCACADGPGPPNAGFCIFNSFAELFGGNQAVDRVRGQQVPKAGPTLDYLGEQLRHDSAVVAGSLISVPSSSSATPAPFRPPMQTRRSHPKTGS